MSSSLSIVRALGIAFVLAGVVAAEKQVDRRMVRPANSLSIEAESLVASAQRNQGDVSVQNMQGFGPGWSGGAQLFWGGTQPVAELLLPFSTTATGKHEVFLHFTRAPDFAVARVQVDDAPAVTFNGYAPAVSPDRVSLGTRDLTPGPHQLRVQVLSKDEKSAGFKVGLDRIELRPLVGTTAARNQSPAESQSRDAGTAAMTIPIVQIPVGSQLRDDSPTQSGIEPLPLGVRIEMVQKARSSTSPGPVQPGTPIRLTAFAPKHGLSGLRMMNGVFRTIYQPRIILSIGDWLDFNFDPVEPHQLHLLDCGWYGNSSSTQIGLSVMSGSQQPIHLSTFTISAGSQRLAAAVVPADPFLELRFAITDPKKTFKTVDWLYCELTPFK